MAVNGRALLLGDGNERRDGARRTIVAKRRMLVIVRSPTTGPKCLDQKCLESFPSDTRRTTTEWPPKSPSLFFASRSNTAANTVASLFRAFARD